MPKFEKSLTQTYDTPLAASRGFIDETIAFLESSGITITDKINADNTSNAVTTITVIAPFNAKLRLAASFGAANKANAAIATTLFSNTDVQISYSTWHRQTASANAQLNNQLVLVVTPDYVGLFDKNAVNPNSPPINCRSNIFTAIKAKNLYTDEYDWFYTLATPTASTGYMSAARAFTDFKAIAANGSLIEVSGGSLNYPRAKSPFPSGGKYSIRPMEFYDSHVALSTYMCYGMGDEVFSSFSSGEDTYYRDIWFLNKL